MCAGVDRTIKVRRVDAVSGKAHDGRVDGASAGIVGVGNDGRDIETAKIKDVGAGEVIDDRPLGCVGPNRRRACGAGAGSHEEVTAQSLSSVEGTRQPGVQYG